jgi:hypothetical protein
MNDPEFYGQQQPKWQPQQPQRPKHGCFFYGCITVIVLLVLIAIAGFLAVRWGLNKLQQYVNEYTETVPVAFPKSPLTDEDRQKLYDRWKAFTDAVESGDKAETIELTADEINALIERDPEMRGRFHVTIDGSKIGGAISIPLDALGFRGRFLNGSATATVSLVGGRLAVYLDQVTVKEKPVPEHFMTELRKQNIAKDFTNNPDNARKIEKLESIEVKDGKLIVKSKPKTKEEPAKEQSEEGKAEKGEEKKAEKPADEKTAPAEPAKSETEKPEPPKSEASQSDNTRDAAPKTATDGRVAVEIGCGGASVTRHTGWPLTATC